MKSWKLFHSLITVFLFIVFFSAIRVVKAQDDFDPNLQKALDSVVAQRNETQDAMRKLRNKLKGSSTIPFTPEDPALRQRFGQTFNEIGGKFNQIISAAKDGDTAAISTAQSNIQDGVNINLGFIREATITLEVGFQPLDKDQLVEAWKTILQASQTLDRKHRKKLYKYLKENVKWKMWSEI